MMIGIAFMPVPVAHGEEDDHLQIMFELSQYALDNRSDVVNSEIASSVSDTGYEEPRSAKTKFREVPQEAPDLKEIEEQVEYASRVTGVRKDFLMGMLVVESDLGRNTGQCTYGEIAEEAEKNHENGLLSRQAWNTFQERKATIRGIAEELGYDYEKLRVSCNPAYYAGTGGALGIPQFMPDTWIEYKDRIATVSGNEKPDPWSVRDGVIAMALKVSDVPGVTEHNVWAEKIASKLYLSGTTSWRYDWYANQIQYWANNYRSLIG